MEEEKKQEEGKVADNSSHCQTFPVNMVDECIDEGDIELHDQKEFGAKASKF